MEGDLEAKRRKAEIRSIMAGKVGFGSAD